MAITNINGTLGRVSFQSILGVSKTLPLGRYDSTYPKFGTPSGEILGVNVKLGRDDAFMHVNAGFPKDRAPNLPSGYNSFGVPTFGSGKQNVVNGSGYTDYYPTKANSSFTFATGGGRVKQTFGGLST